MKQLPHSMPQGIKTAFAIPAPSIKKFIENFHSEMEKGLSGKRSSLKMIPTYVTRPTGDEKGRFLALDIGGTNFRVWAVRLYGKRKIGSAFSRKFVLKKKDVTGKGEDIFLLLARRVKELMAELGVLPDERNKLGFTFSFPIENKSIDRAVLIRWTKGFSASGVLGKDVVGLLNESLRRVGLAATKAVSIANDTASTFAAKNYEDPNCSIGVILGTGTNACYSERIENIKKLEKPVSFPSKEMLVNIEWGNFNKIDLTAYDRELDRRSSNPGEQILEKMVSGMYLGGLVRLVARRLIEEKTLFRGRFFHIFERFGNFKTEYVSRIDGDSTKKLNETDKLLKSLGVSSSILSDRKLLKEICGTVSTRAAVLSALAVAAVITKLDPHVLKKHTAAIDGSLYEKHPKFSRNMELTLKKIFKRKAKNIKLSLTKDGSGIGAAIIAAGRALDRRNI